ncbi:MAG: gliding motility protein GldM, partial [Flavobacteriales bacterium]|nr:gliding motility protein GldM [Flavobacteriales bacterium]
MAAIKLPPRQRMINMMYLVLTAMLAMNVSKEVLDAFAVLDADLVRSEQAHEQRSRMEYAAFDEAARKFPDRFGELSLKAHRVEEHADSLVRHIEDIKLRVMAEAEGRTEEELTGKAADGRDT